MSRYRARIRGTAAEPSILGRIQITDGSATFAGTKYQLQRGDVYFSNPVRIDPVIDHFAESLADVASARPDLASRCESLTKQLRRLLDATPPETGASSTLVSPGSRSRSSRIGSKPPLACVAGPTPVPKSFWQPAPGRVSGVPRIGR